jgi:predicted AAA+ superfamily ATPase
MDGFQPGESVLQNREILPLIREKLADEKAILLLGPRQVGKSTLLQQLKPDFKTPVLWMNGDDTDTRTLLSNPNATSIKI